MRIRRDVLIGALLMLSSLTAFAQQEALEEIVVTGKLPGPALWKVSDGENNLWIFALLSPIPKGMIWESARVEKVIKGIDEFIEPPGADIDVSPLVMLNPINYVRGYRLAKRLGRNPDGKSLQDVLPPGLYRRFAALKTRYMPDHDELETMRPMFAIGQLGRTVLAQNNLVADRGIMKKIKRLVRRNRRIKRTATEVRLKLEGGYGKLADRTEKLINSLPPEQEIACMETLINRYENDIESMKSRANSWAQGYVDDLRDGAVVFDDANPCALMMLASSEGTTVEDLQKRSQQQWLAAAEKALTANRSTFAVLDIGELVSERGLLAQLKAKGYAVRAP
ncbi:MAG: TraB/GumN family protein [Gammaproteobacteria bacterium]|jgi:hypothetical protein|nr:MAG: TraB/GumN family protein [Gammaproteobacteria bacterium]